MPLTVKILNNIKMNKQVIIAILLLLIVKTSFAQDKIKVDGVAVVVGKNIVLDSDIEKFQKEINLRSEGKIDISRCEMLEEIMTQKLMAHHAVIDSIEISEARVDGEVDRIIANFTQQLGSLDKVVEFYGFNDESDLKKELGTIQREQLLIQGEKEAIVSKVSVTPDEVKNYFNTLKQADNLPEFGSEIELAQIVLHIEPTKEEVQRVIAKLKDLKKQIEDGASMRLKAMLESDDPGVSQNGGLYQVQRDGQFIKEFKEVAFSLAEGEVSEPFKTDFGYHIIKVEKIRGQEVDARHILIQPDIDEEEVSKSKEQLEKIRKRVLDGSITFEEAVAEFSNDKSTKNNKGVIINPYTQDTHFELTRMDPSLYDRVVNLNKGDITEPFFDQERGGPKMFKIILMKDKTEAHTADFVKDYVKIQKMALLKKKEETIEKWNTDKIKDTYIKLNGENVDCEFKNNWSKK